MRAVVVYESMYGNTHTVADAVGDGLRAGGDVVVLPVGEARPELLDGADLVVVGGPTHVHGMSRASTRRSAAEAVEKPDHGLVLEPGAQGPGLREWFASLGTIAARAAAFDTRIDMPAALTGRASKGIGKELRGHGLRLVAGPESFLVTKDSRLVPGEEDRARAWGRRLAQTVG